MQIKPLRKDLERVLKKNHLLKKFKQQISFFEKNHFYPSLHTEKLRPKHLNIPHYG